MSRTKTVGLEPPAAEVLPPASPAVPTAPELPGRSPGRPFKPGAEWTGNAKGRELGSRNKLTTDYLDAIYKQFQESGPFILRDMAPSRSITTRVKFIELVHDLLPRNAVLDGNVSPTLPRPLAEMTDADWEIALGIRVTKRYC
jgi:hypothetical protein